MLENKLARWSGPAAAAGGVLWLLPWSGWLGDIGDLVRLLMSLPGLLLIAVGLVGLHRCIAVGGNRGSTLGFGMALIGLLLIISPVVATLITGVEESDAPPVLVIAGVIIMVLGMVAMGIITISRKALGALSFVPLTLAVSYIGFLVSFGLTGNDPSVEFLVPIFINLTMLCWLLLGVALWIRREETAEVAYRM